MRNPAFVFGLAHAGLAAVRSLGRAGIPVIGIDWYPRHPGAASRYCTYKRCPPPAEAENLLDFLIEQGKQLELPGAVILADDHFVEFVSSRRDEVTPYYHLPLPARGVLEAMVDKRRQYELAEFYTLPIDYMINPSVPA